jgi:HAD superfamily hydrolase (TIGR01509 family)
MMQRVVDCYNNTNKTKLNPKAVLFDMDGVLFNSMPYHARAWYETMQQYGLDFTEYDAYLNEGRTGESTINAFFPQKYNRKATAEEVEKIYQIKSEIFNRIANIQPIPHIYDFLLKVKAAGLMIFLVTGSGQKSLLETLNKNFPNIFHPDRMITAYDVKYGKPHPEPYLMALKKGNLSSNEAIVIENAPLGVRSAVAANIFTIAVNTGILREEELLNEGANLVFPSVKELIDSWIF